MVDRRAHDRNVSSSSPAGAAGLFFSFFFSFLSSMVNFQAVLILIAVSVPPQCYRSST